MPNVPVITLSGICSTADILSELPLPGPTQQSHSKSLLFHPRVADEARLLLSIRDISLTPQLIHALSSTNTDHIELKDGFADENIRGEIPELLKVVLAQNPTVFNASRSHGSGTPTSYLPGLPGSSQFSQYATVPCRSQVPAISTQSPMPQIHQVSTAPIACQQQLQVAAVNQAALRNQVTYSGGDASSVQTVACSSSTFVPTVPPKKAGTPPADVLSISVSSSAVNGTAKEKPKGTKHGQKSVPRDPLSVPPVEEKDQLPASDGQSTPVVVKALPRKAKVVMQQLSHDEIEKHVQRKSLDGTDYVEGVQLQMKSGGKDLVAELKLPSIKLKKLDAGTIKLATIKKGVSLEASSHAPNEVLPNDRQGSHKRLSSSSSEEDIECKKKGHKRSRSTRLDDEEDDETYEPVSEHSSGRCPPASQLHKKKRSGTAPASALRNSGDGDAPTFSRFISAMDSILESAEDSELLKCDPQDDDIELPPDSLAPRHIVTELCSEAAKLKSTGITNQMPHQKIVSLVNVLLWNIKDGRKLLPLLNQEEGSDQEQLLWRELTLDRVMRSIEAALTALHLMTSAEMPKELYVEDVIEQIAVLTKYQLINSIYPEFDPVYKTECEDMASATSKSKKSRGGNVKQKASLQMYNKLCEVVSAAAELVDVQELTDTVILHFSALGVAPFFVENVQELQLGAIKLITAIFSRYDKHRQLILEDLLSSLARLPTSKRSLRSFRVDDDQAIQMMSALVLQLIQCVVRISEESKSEDGGGEKAASDMEMSIVTSYEMTMRTGHQFLTVFLKRCTAKGDDDYRPLFENFINDLLVTVNKPEWPAAELLLSLLGRLLMQQFTNKSADITLRVASLDYLGVIAARLRKDSLACQLSDADIDDLLDQVKNDDSINDSLTASRDIDGKEADEPATSEKRIQALQCLLLRHLRSCQQKDPMTVYAHNFYAAQWYRDAMVYAEKSAKLADETLDISQVDRTTEILQNAEKRKYFLLDEIKCNIKATQSRRQNSKLDSYQASIISRYLASQRPFAQSFDVYLTQILKVLSETAVAVRTKAMKCLTMVVEVDPAILARADIERGVHGRLLDQSTAVREAAVELIGKFVLIRPELTDQYYDMLAERILDTGTSVRKRVIKIFKDICQEQPEFSKIPEMCIRMIRRVNDEEGIKKLVTEVFQTMWFTPMSIREKDTHRLLQRVVNITEVVAACKDSSYEFIEQLLRGLLKKEDTCTQKPVEQACRQIIDCLIENVLKLEQKTVTLSEGKQVSSPRFVACLSTMYLLAKVKPDLMVDHAEVIQPYLQIQCNAQADYLVLQNVAKILELVIPRLSHPSETFLARVEEDMMKLILKHGMTVLQSCVSCLAAIVNGVTHNYKLVKDCFQKFFGFLVKTCAEHKANAKAPALVNSKPTLLRSLFTVGILCKHFDFDNDDLGDSRLSVKEKALELLMYFMGHEDDDVRLKSLNALGFYCTHYHEAMLGIQVKDLYQSMLSNKDSSVVLKCQVLRNLQNYLTQEEDHMSKADSEWQNLHMREDLKEMGDVQSGMASTVMQVYLKQVLEAYFSSHLQVRTSAATVIHLILKQGLVHPVQCIPYLISMATDCEVSVRNTAEQLLQDIDKRFPGFVHMKAMAGMRMSYRLQRLIQQDIYEPVRGFRNEECPQALNQSLYSIIRTNRQHRRALITSMLNLFDDTSKTLLGELMYMADNLAFFPYQLLDEPFFTVHHIDIIVSVSGSNLLQAFKEALVNKSTEGSADNNEQHQHLSAEDDEENVQSLTAMLPADVLPLQECMLAAQGCVLLLALKQHLKSTYSITDGKAQKYSPAEAAKVWDRPINRRVDSKFNPSATLSLLREGTPSENLDDEGRQKLVKDYIEFRRIMMNVDPMDDNDEVDNPIGATTAMSPTVLLDNSTDQDATGLNAMTANANEGSSTVPQMLNSTPVVQVAPAVSTPRSKGVNSDKKNQRKSKSAQKSHSKKSHKKKKKVNSDDEDSSGDDPDYLG